MPTTDSNGIIRYLDTDGAPTPPVLNLGMQSVSDALSRKGFYTALNKTDRDTYAAAYAPTSSKPLLVNRQDLPANSRWEWTPDGTNWYPLNSYPIIYNSSGATTGPFTSSALVVNYNLAAAPYPRKLVINAGLYADIASGSWLGALSVNASSVSAAQRRAQFPSGSRYSSLALSMTYNLPSDQATTVRLWVERSSASGSLVTANDSRLNYIDIQAYTNMGD